jgi:uncharacterized protein with PQ loop repeat
MDILLILSFSGTISAVLANLSSILSVKNQISSKHADQIPGKFLYFNHLSQVLWFLYAIRMKDAGLILVNISTSILSMISLLFLKFSTNSLYSFLPSYTLTLMLSISFCSFCISSEVLGILGSILSTISAFSTLESILKVFKTGLHTFIDLNMSLLILTCSISWFFYGLATKDKIVVLTNLIWSISGVSLVLTHLLHRPLKIRGSSSSLIEYLKSKVLNQKYIFTI